MRGTRLTVVQEVVEFLRRNIEDGTWKVGDKIPSEQELTETLAVSRASARVAIQQFNAVGVLESQHGRGTFVRKADLGAFGRVDSLTEADSEDLRQVLEFRRMVEPEGCALAAAAADEACKARLNECLERMRQAADDAQAYMAADGSFHEEIARASGNRPLLKVLGQLFAETRADHRRMVEAFGVKDGLYYHQVILKAIEEQDTKAAKRLMTEHLQAAIDRIL